MVTYCVPLTFGCRVGALWAWGSWGVCGGPWERVWGFMGACVNSDGREDG